MALKIRLSRGGSKARPYYRIVIADARAPRDGRFIERVGSYNPMLPKDHPERLIFNEERLTYWYGVGARPTDRVARFMDQLNLCNVKHSIPQQTKQDKPKAKALERIKEKEEARAAKEAEANAPQEAPAEEAAAE